MKNAGIMPVWYIGAIDLPYSDKENVFTIKSWKELQKIIVQLG